MEGFLKTILPGTPPTTPGCRAEQDGTPQGQGRGSASSFGAVSAAPPGPVKACWGFLAGWRDTEDEEGPLVYILLASRRRPGHFDEFCVYKGSRAEHGAFLPPGFHESGFQVSVAVLVQDQLGATVVAENR